MTEREKIIKNYIIGYNAFDTDKMVLTLTTILFLKIFKMV